MTYTSPPSPTPLPFSYADTQQRLSRDTDQLITNFSIFSFVILFVTLPFETSPEDIYNLRPIREPHGSYLYYIDTHSLTETLDEPSF